MRILFVNDHYFSITGSSIANRNLCRMLINRGIDVAILTTSIAETRYRPERIYYLPALMVRYPVRLALPLLDKINRIISDEQPDIIHLQGLSPLSLAVLWIAKRRSIPVAAGIHDLPRNISIFFPLPVGLTNIFATSLLTYWLSKVDVAIAPSQFAEVHYNALGVKTNIHIISNGVDLSIFSHDVERARMFSNQYLSEANENVSFPTIKTR